MRWITILLVLPLTIASTAIAADPPGLSAVVHKPSVVVHSQPAFGSATVVTLRRDMPVKIAAQDGLWYQLALDDGRQGFVRVNEVRVASSGKAESETMQVLLTGKSGRGRVSETAGVRGLDQSELRSAAFDAAQLAQMQNNRASVAAAEHWASQRGLVATRIAWTGEVAATEGEDELVGKQSGGGGVMRSIGRGLLGSMLGVSEKAIPKTQTQLTEEELALGPLIAGRVLGARPLWPDAEAQRRVNLAGRWLASQTPRPDLPWTFGVIDSPEYNAFAAPGGYILITSGLYQLAGSDEELAAVLSHEINHVVRRDHYEVIRKQEMASIGKDLASSQVSTGGGLGGGLARSYVEKNGAAIMLSSLDRDAEFRADEFAQVYISRGGMNPLALYAVLQKMAAMGSESEGLAELYKTHPSLDDRLDRIDARGYGPLDPYLERDLATR